MNTLYINYILEISKLKSINRAAQSLYISQPYLSSVLKKVEKEIGYSIFTRTINGIQETERGSVFIESAKKIQRELDLIFSLSNSTNNTESLYIVAAYSSFNLQCFLDFQERYPSQLKKDSYFETSIDEIINNIIQGKCNLGILFISKSYFDTHKDVFDQHKLETINVCGNIKVQAIMSKLHELSKKELITKEDFGNQPHVYYTSQNYEKLLPFPELRIMENSLVVSDRGSFLDVLRGSNYVSISPEISKHQKLNGFTCVPIEGLENEGLLICIKLKHYSLTKRETQFIKFMRGQYIIRG